MSIRERLGRELLFFDGGMGTLLQERGLEPGELPEVWNLKHPEEVEEIHRRYFEAGSDIVLTNTFGANACKFHDDNWSLEKVICAAVKNAKRAQEQGVLGRTKNIDEMARASSVLPEPLRPNRLSMGKYLNRPKMISRKMAASAQAMQTIPPVP